MRLGRILQGMALLAVSLVLSLVLFEIGLRASGRFAVVGLHSVSADDYARIPGLWEPGQDFLNLANRNLPHRIHTNALGLRGPETTLLPRGPRVLCLGDSFTFGDFVNDDETLPAQLERRLPDVEVLNGGIGGTTIVDQREYMRRYLSLRPDVVVLLYFDNDLEDLLADPPSHVGFARNRRWKSGLLSPLYYVVRDSATFNAFLKVRGTWRALGAPEPAHDAGHAAPPWLADHVARYAAEAAALRDELAAEGIGLVVAAFPHPYIVSGKYTRDFIGPVVQALAARGIPMLDLTPALRASGLGVEGLFLLPHDGHATGRAYGIAADVLAPLVADALEASRSRRAGSREPAPS